MDIGKQKHFINNRRLCALTTLDALAEKFDYFLLDCDGVLWQGGEAIEGSLEALDYLINVKNKKAFFITNSSTKSREQSAEKFRKAQINTSIDYIYPASYAAPMYLKLKHPEVTKVYMIGNPGLKEELEKQHIDVVGGSAEEEKKILSSDSFTKFPLDPSINGVIVGLDHGFTYNKICLASMLVQRGLVFVATSPDATDRIGDRLIPGTGCITEIIKTSTGIPPVVIGKPNPYMIELIKLEHEISDADTCKMIMIGDRLDTDILFGKKAGVATCLVMTGVVDEKSFEEELCKSDGVVPDYVMPRLGTFDTLATL